MLYEDNSRMPEKFRSDVNHIFYCQTSTIGSRLVYEKLLWTTVARFSLLSISHFILEKNDVDVAIAFRL